MINELYLADLGSVLSCNLPWEKLKDKNILITGATGLIGSFIVDLLMKLEFVNVFAMGRNLDKGKVRFKDYFNKPNFNFICHNVVDKLELNINFDYIIHAASGAQPSEYDNHPVETMTGNFLGMYNLLEYARFHKLKRFLYISSSEVYGHSYNKIDKFSEEHSEYINPLKVRSCYPSSKRASETLLVSYAKEYGVDGVIIRPCHIYGPTMSKEDDRAISEFIRNGISGNNIVLKSSGKQIRSYMYITDMVSALFYVLFYGKSSEAYNISNSELVSIKELAELVSEISNSKIIYENINTDDNVVKTIIDNTKLMSLGWGNKVKLKDGIIKTINILR